MVRDLTGKEVDQGELHWDKKSGLHDPLVKRVVNQVPQGGTDLGMAVDALSRLIPKPGRIILITDGLPGKTSGRDKLKNCPKSRKGVVKVSADCRISIAIKSVEKLNAKLSMVPIDIILLPMEGDSDAIRFYSLVSGISAGRLITPSVDWLLDE